MIMIRNYLLRFLGDGAAETKLSFFVPTKQELSLFNKVMPLTEFETIADPELAEALSSPSCYSIFASYSMLEII